MMQKDHHPYIVRITYQNAAPYHIFVDSETEARILIDRIEDEVGRGKHLFRYISNVNAVDPEYALITTLISLEGIRDICTIAKTAEMSDARWLG